MGTTTKLLRASGLIAFMLGLAACAGSASTGARPTQTITVTPSSSEAPETSASIDPKAVRQAFLDSVCPSAYAFGVLENAAIAAGGWEDTEPGVARPYANRALKAVQSTARDLKQRTGWPSDLEVDVSATADEFLAMAAPLQQVVDAQSGSDMARAWKKLIDMPRVAEQRVRTNLGLGLAWTKNDGCPQVPSVAPPPEGSGASGQDAIPATGPMPVITSPMVESTGDGLCNFDPYNLPRLVGPDSDRGGTQMIQVLAVIYGFNPGSIDGEYGPKTVDAVKQLQSHLGVAPDGQVGPATWSALKSDYCG